MEDVTIRRGVEYMSTEQGKLTLDLYYPKDHRERRPAVVIVLGYPDVGVVNPFGCQFREAGMVVSWCRLFAACGMVGVVYETRNPATDVHAVLSYIRANGSALGIDETRLGLWSSSGNTPVALSVLIEGKARGAAIFCGMTLDLDGSTAVADGARQFYFANPTAGRRVEDLPPDTALFIARAGKDEIPGLNQALDRFVAAALRCNLPVTLMNHPTGPHGFDYADDSETSKQIVRAAFAFLQANLAPAAATAASPSAS